MSVNVQRFPTFGGQKKVKIEPWLDSIAAFIKQIHLKKQNSAISNVHSSDIMANLRPACFYYPMDIT